MLPNKFNVKARCFQCNFGGLFPLALGCNTSMTVSHKFERGDTFPYVNLHPAIQFLIQYFNEIPLFDFCLPMIWEHMCVPRIHRTPPDGDLEPEGFLAQSAAWNKPKLQSITAQAISIAVGR